MNLSRSYARCLGEFKDHWLKKSEPCPRRSECARHAVMTWDQLRGDEVTTMQHCVDEGKLSAFLPLSEMRDEDDA